MCRGNRHALSGTGKSLAELLISSGLFLPKVLRQAVLDVPEGTFFDRNRHGSFLFAKNRCQTMVF